MRRFERDWAGIIHLIVTQTRVEIIDPHCGGTIVDPKTGQEIAEAILEGLNEMEKASCDALPIGERKQHIL